MTTQQIIGSIGFDDHQIRCIIGDLPEERVTEQYIFVDLKAEADFSKCLKTDSVHDTIDYVAMAQLCSDVAQKGKHQMLEVLAWQMTEALLKAFPVESVWIRLKKPGGLPTSKYAIIELKRQR